MIVFRTREVRVVFGTGGIDSVGGELEQLNVQRALVVSTPGRVHLVGRIQANAGERIAGSFGRAVVHVPGACVDAARAVLDRVQADSLVSVGGGAATGIAKALAVDTGVPILAVPTTFSGSEVTSIWGRTDPDGKRTGRDTRAAPRSIVYDPELTRDLPLSVSGPSGMNAVAHCVEALYAVDRNPVATLHAEEGLRLLASALRGLADDPASPPAHHDALLGAFFAGSALEMTSMGLHHKLCHVLGGAFGLPHALVHAVLLPHVVAFNQLSAPDSLARVAAALGGHDPSGALHQLNRSLGVPSTLVALGFDRSMIGEAARLATSQEYPNPRPVTVDGVRTLLESACSGANPGDSLLSGT